MLSDISFDESMGFFDESVVLYHCYSSKVMLN